MQINELIENHLNEKFPGKTIKVLMEVDPISFTPFNRLVVNGQRTSFGFSLETFMDGRLLSGKPFDDYNNDFARDFVQNVVKGMELGHTL